MRARVSALVTLGCLILTCPTEASKRKIYDFIANRPMAHLDRQGLFIDCGGPGFYKYIQGNHKIEWLMERGADGVPGAWAPGLRAKLYFPLSEAQGRQATRLEVRLKPLAGAQASTVFVNDQKIKNVQLEEGWQTMVVSLPSGILRRGENSLRIHLARSLKHKGDRYSVALSFVRLAQEGSPEAPPDLSLWLSSVLHQKDGSPIKLVAAVPSQQGAAPVEALNLAGPGALSYYLLVPKGANLEFRPGLRTGAPMPCRMRVLAELDGGKGQELWKGAVGPGAEWKPVSLSLGSIADKPVRLSFEASAECGDFAAVGDPYLVGPGASPRLDRTKKPRNVVFWLIDTVRADEFECMSKTRIKTPNFTALSKEAVRFEHAYVQGNESKSSHASIFTGTYPVVHKVINEKAKVPLSMVTIAEALKSGGLYTAGFIANGYISSAWNFHQGFQKYINYVRENRPPNTKAVWKEAGAWLRANHEKPFYLYMGTIDPHVTYRYHKGITEKYAPANYTGRFKKGLAGVDLGSIKEGKIKVTEEEKKYIRALHDGAITYNDIYFGEMVATLKELGHYENTMIVVTADHGDEFWEHGTCGHGHSMYEELVSVPLLLYYPPLLPKNRKVASGVDDLDIMPTLLDALGLPVDQQIQGESLLALANEPDPVYPRTSINTLYNNAYAVRLKHIKYHLYAGDKVKLFDVSRDPGETKDLIGKKPIMERLGADLTSIFVAFQPSWRKAKDGVPSNLTRSFARRIGAR